LSEAGFIDFWMRDLQAPEMLVLTPAAWRF
jgi:hypothetical protein